MSANTIFSFIWTLDVNKLPRIALDLYISQTTRGLSLKHQYVPGQDELHKARGKTFVIKRLSLVSIYTVDIDHRKQFGDLGSMTGRWA